MKKVILFYFVLIFGLFSCKSEFEKLRTNGDSDIVYKKALDYYKKEDFYKAQILFEQILGRFRGKKEAEDLYFKYAYTHYYLQNYILSSSYFDNFANTYITSPLREEAAFMSAFSHVKQSPEYRLDQTYTLKAIDQLQNFANQFPKSNRIQEANKLIDELREKLEKKANYEGNLYFDLKNYNSAAVSFSNLLKDFPETNKAEEVRFMIIKSYFHLAINSIYSKKIERFEQAQLAAEAFLNRYTKSKFRKETAVILKNTKENIKFINK